ncbi:MAG: metallophosphoesterase [Planctomycetota bacterium]
MTLRLLCLGDLHLGRRPRHLPERLDEYDIPVEQLTPARGWQNAVDYAVRESVDAVLLAGDVVESDNRYFEALAPLERGIRTLRDAGIPVIGVAGNHDHQVLEPLAASLEGFELLGRGGKWESTEIGRSEKRLRIWGWSFPSRWYADDPVTDFPDEPDGTASIGLLHCHLDAIESEHAPTTRRNLEARSPRAWLLGHIHKPSALSGPRPIGYLGTVVGLDASETGVRGGWRLEIDEHEAISIEQVPLAPLRWETIDLDIEELRSEADLSPAIANALRRAHDHWAGGLGPANVIGVSLRLVGRSSLHRRLRKSVRELEAEEIVVVHDETTYAVVRIIDLAAPKLDLERIALGHDPAALLAQRLLILEGEPNDEWRALVDAARPALFARAENGMWDALDPAPLEDDAIAERLRRSGLRTLEDLLAQIGSPTLETSDLEQGALF